MEKENTQAAVKAEKGRITRGERRRRLQTRSRRLLVRAGSGDPRRTTIPAGLRVLRESSMISRARGDLSSSIPRVFSLWSIPTGERTTMASAAQIEANQRSAKRSTGPETPKGKWKTRRWRLANFRSRMSGVRWSWAAASWKTPRKAPNELRHGTGERRKRLETLKPFVETLRVRIPPGKAGPAARSESCVVVGQPTLRSVVAIEIEVGMPR